MATLPAGTRIKRLGQPIETLAVDTETTPTTGAEACCGCGESGGAEPVETDCCPDDTVLSVLTLTVANHELIPDPTSVTIIYRGSGIWSNFVSGGFDVSTGGGVFVGPGGLTYRVLCSLNCGFDIPGKWKLYIVTHIQGEPEPNVTVWVNAELKAPPLLPSFVCEPFHAHAEYMWASVPGPPNETGTYDVTE